MNQIENIMDNFQVGSRWYGCYVTFRNGEAIPSTRVVLNLISSALTIGFEAGKNSDKLPSIMQLNLSIKFMYDSDSIPELLRNKYVIGFRTRVGLVGTDNTLSISDYGDYVVLEPDEDIPHPSTMKSLLEKAFQIALVAQKDRSAISISDIRVIIKPIPYDPKSNPGVKATIGFKCRVVSERSLVMDRLFGSDEGEAPSEEVESSVES